MATSSSRFDLSKNIWPDAEDKISEMSKGAQFNLWSQYFTLMGGSLTAGKTPPAAFKGGTTGVSPIDWSGMKVETDAPYKPGGFGPVPSEFPPAQIGGLLGIMGTDDEYWKTILGS